MIPLASTVTIGEAFTMLLCMLLVAGVGIVSGFFLGKQHAEIEAERKRDAEEDARLELR